MDSTRTVVEQLLKAAAPAPVPAERTASSELQRVFARLAAQGAAATKRAA